MKILCHIILIKEIHFARDDDVMNAVDHFLRDKNGTFYTEGIRLFHDRWTVNVGGEYSKKCLHLIFTRSEM